MDGKITSIRQIVKIKEFIKKWKFVALGPKSCEAKPSKHGGMSSDEIQSTLRNSNVHCESDEESSQSQTLDDVPKGYLAVYVGAERDVRRFIIPTSYLTDPLFTVLLDKAEEEFGFDHNGGLMIPCHIETFKYLLQCIKNHNHHTSTGMVVAGTTASDLGMICNAKERLKKHFNWIS